MESVVTYDSASPYDLEYRSIENDAWYSVCLVLDAGAETLTVNFLSSPEAEAYKVVFSAGDFMTEPRLEDLVGRFRPISRQLQDDKCLRASVGTHVCAAFGVDDNDLLFHDAIVEDVKRRPHSFGGEEECLCTFVLHWQHGLGCGTLTHANIARICVLEPTTDIDHRLCAFSKLVNKKIASSKSISVGSVSIGTPNDKEKSCSSIKKVVGSSQNRLLKSETTMKIKSLTCKDEDDSAEMRRCGQWTGDNEDMGPKSCNVDGSVTTDGHFFILINNLEKDLTPSSIKNFIFEETTILPEVCVFPRQPSDHFARGAIMVDCQMKAQSILEFLDNPNRLVVSSRGRPWVITEKVPARTVGADIWNLVPVSQGFGSVELVYKLIHNALDSNKQEVYASNEETRPKRIRTRELEVVSSGTKSYERAEKLKNLFVEYLYHESQVFKKLILEENRILRSSQPAS